MRFSGKILFCLALLLLTGAEGWAASSSLGRFGYWTAQKIEEGGSTVCYMTLAAKPPSVSGKGKKKKRGEVVLMITHRPSEGSTDVVSYAVGANFKPATDVSVRVGQKAFAMFTKGDAAWARDAATDHALTAALRAGQSVTFRGALASGEALADTVNLKGADEAYVAIGKACGLSVAPLKKAAKMPKKETHKALKPLAPEAPKKR